MNAAAKSLIFKAQECLDLAQKSIDDEKSHEIVGYNLAQATEFLLKALCAVKGLEFPDDLDPHNLDDLLTLLEENNLSAVSSHADVVELTPYNTTDAQIRRSERLNLKEYYGHVEELKKLVGKFAL